jgi:hypothetical protein
MTRLAMPVIADKRVSGTRYYVDNQEITGAVGTPVPAPTGEGSIVISNSSPAWIEKVHPGSAFQHVETDGTTWDWQENLNIADDAFLYFGNDQDVTITYDEAGDDRLEITGTDWHFTIDQMTILSSTSARPTLELENINADTSAPSFQLYHNSGSPSDNDDLGRLDFYGETDTSAKFRYAYTLVESADVTNADAAGRWHFLVAMDAGLREMIQLSGYNGSVGEGEIIFNNGAQDVDFIFKSDTHDDALTVDGATGQPRFGLLGAGFVQSDANGDLSSAAIAAGDLPAHTHAGAGQGGTITHAVTTGQTTDDHHAEVHVVNSTGPHAEAGLTSGHVLRATGAAAFSFGALIATDLPAHDLLSLQHGDTLAAAVSRGSLIYGNASPAWAELVHPAAAGYALATTALDIAFNQTPTWAGRHTFNAGIELSDGQSIGITGNELLIVNAAADNFTFSGVGSVVVPNGAWVGADANCAWLFDNSNNDVTTQDNVGIGIISPVSKLTVAEATGANLRLLRDDASVSNTNTLGLVSFAGNDSGTGEVVGAQIRARAAQAWFAGNAGTDLIFRVVPNASTALSEAMRIKESGDVGLGTDAPEAKLHLFEAGALSLIVETVSDTQAPNFTSIRSNAGPAAVTDGRRLGAWRAFGYDGVGDIIGMRIAAEVDGTPGVNDMPTRIIFEVTADGAAAVTERMRIDQAGRVGIGTAGAVATSAILELASTTGALLVSRMTTAQRNALTAINGMIIYNSTTGEFNFREGGAWVTGSGLA